MDKSYKVYLDARFGEDIERIRRWLRKPTERKVGDYFEVALVAHEHPELILSAIIQKSDIYLHGFKNRFCSFYLTDYKTPVAQTGTYQHLQFSGSYPDLGAWRRNDNQLLSYTGLINSMMTLANHRQGNFSRDDREAIAFLVFIVSESLRFDNICCLFANIFGGDRNLILTKGFIRAIVTNWKKGSLEKSPDVEIKPI